MKRFVRVLFSLLLLVGMLLELAACGLPAPHGGETSADAVPADAEPAAVEPVAEPTPEPYEVPADLPLRISEVMPSNKATIAADDLFSDWVELYNAGTESLSLRGVSLCCDGESALLGEGELAPGAYLLVFCDDSGLPGHAPFVIPKEGATLTLRADGTDLVLDEFALPACEADRSAIRLDDGSVFVTTMTTPGFENSGAGFEQRQQANVCDSPLQISEVMVFELKAGDWVELHNVGADALNLSDYYLSDSGKDRMAFRLPDRVLGPGEYTQIRCTKSQEGEDAPFKLNSQYEHLYLSRADGTLADYALLQNIPYKGTFGRVEGENGFFYFTAGTPGEPNPVGEGFRRYADKPVLIGRDGIFDDVDSVEVVLSAPGEIHYTTDGSVPTEDSPLYTEPLHLTSTSVLRAVNIEPGCLADSPLNLSFIINEHHTLPVVSLLADPDRLLGREGIYYEYKHKYEMPGAVEVFEQDGGSFSIACGIKLHGAVSKKVSDKKSLKLCFRSRYDGQLHYDLFGNGVTDFGSILLRHPAEDHMSTYLRDILIHDMAMQCFPSLPSMDYKFSVLYINGNYWGIYGIREAHSKDHYANHFGYDPDSSVAWQRLWNKETPVGQACEFVMANDMTDEKNYEYACRYIDVDSVIAWTILQAWCGNIDCYPSNVRYYYSKEDDVLRFALSDLDLGMFSYDLLDVPLYGSSNGGKRSSYDYNVVARKLFSNREYQRRMAEMLANALRGAMRDENVRDMLNGYRDEIAPEVPRDLKRWFPGMSEKDAMNSWNHLVDQLCDYATRNEGRSRQLIDSFLNHLSPRFTQDEIDYYFGDLLS